MFKRNSRKERKWKQNRSQETSQHAQLIRDNLPEEHVKLMDVACEREGLRHGYLLFLYTVMDSIYTRGCFEMPCVSTMAGDPWSLWNLCLWGLFTALSCPYGGYLIRRHNDLHNLTATLLREICTNVTIELHLQPLTGEHLDYRTANR